MSDFLKLAQKKNQIPIVHQSRSEFGYGLLSERQKKWVNTPANETSIENPVLFRHTQEQKSKNVRSDSKENSFLVRGLISEKNDESKSSGGILEKIQETRKARHNAAYEDMMQALEAISLELEPEIKKLCEDSKTLLHNNKQVINDQIEEIQNDKILVTLTSKDLNLFWASIEKFIKIREDWINDLHLNLKKIEEKRSKRIGEVLTEYMQVLCRVAHLMPSDVQRLLEEEILKANTSILNNIKSYADLKKRLLTVDIEKEKKLHYQWEIRCEDWKSLKLKEAIQKYKDFMQSDTVCNSLLIRENLESLVEQQTKLNEKRLELLSQLTQMKPPSATKTSVYQWNQAVTRITEDIDKLQQKFLSFVRVEHQNILNQCGNKIIGIRNELFNIGAVVEEFLEEFTEDIFLPLLGERKSCFEQEEERLEKHFTEICAQQKQHLKLLFKHAQGAAHVWDNHELGLSREENNLQEMLDKCRREHDYQNQMRETKLDIVMDRMRQESTEEALTSNLKLSLHMMDEIKKGYHEFHQQQMQLSEKYPNMVLEEIKRYGSSLSQYFNVCKINGHSCESLNDNQASKNSITLSSGTKYVSLPKDSDVLELSHSELEQLQVKNSLTELSAEDIPVEEQSYIKSYLIPVSMIKKLIDSLQIEFLEHLEFWEKDALKRAKDVVKAKNEEIDNELDLRLHLHKPRPNRAEKDVHDVRAAELLLHRERVQQHCNGMTESLGTIRVTYQQMIDDHSRQKEAFNSSVDRLEESFGKAPNTQELKKLQEEVNGSMGNYIDTIRQSVREFRSYLDETLSQLRFSNANFRKAFKLFSEGGTFSPDEVEEYRKRLEKCSAKIDQCEGSIIGELEGLETKRLDVAKEFAGKLEDKFKYHLFDLTFMEKIKRWLSNIQVKIKAEVANSNSQSEKLSKMIAIFGQRVNMLLDHSDNEKAYKASELHDTLQPLIAAFGDRVKYLDCALKRDRLSLFSLQENLLRGENTKDKKNRLRKTSKKVSARSKAMRTASQQSPIPFSPCRSPISQTSRDSVDEINLNESSYKPLSSYGNRQASAQRITTYHGGKYDQRYQVFGEYNAEEDVNCMTFSMLQLRILQNGLDGLLSSAELYYRQKGQRSTTRNQFISETFEGCAETLILKLRKYQKQTKVYQNACVQEFRMQIKTFLKSMEKLPLVLMASVADDHQCVLQDDEEKIEEDFRHERERNERHKMKHQTLLRPTLGHPKNKSELKKLLSAEEERRKKLIVLVDTFYMSIKQCETNHIKQVVAQLQQKSAKLLGEFDQLVTPADVIEGQPTVQPKTEKQLLKEKLYGNRDAAENIFEEFSETPTTWPAVVMHECNWTDDFNMSRDILEIVTSIESCKKTYIHEMAIDARDKQINSLVQSSLHRIKEISKFRSELLDDEEKWKLGWNSSLNKILQLY